MLSYQNQLRSPKRMEPGGSLILHLALWLALCLLKIPAFEVQASMKCMLQPSTLKSYICITKRKKEKNNCHVFHDLHFFSCLQQHHFYDPCPTHHLECSITSDFLSWYDWKS